MNKEDKLSQNNEKLSLWAQAASLFFGATFGVAAIYAFAALYFDSSIGEALQSVHGVLVNPNALVLHEDEKSILMELIGKGHIISANAQLADITTFYSSVISTLTTIIAVLGIVGFFVIKSLSKNAAEELAEKAIEHHFEKQNFHNQVDIIVRARTESFLQGSASLIDDSEERFEAIDDALGRIGEMVNRFAAYENALARLDDYEGGGGNIELSDPDKNNGEEIEKEKV